MTLTAHQPWIGHGARRVLDHCDTPWIPAMTGIHGYDDAVMSTQHTFSVDRPGLPPRSYRLPPSWPHSVGDLVPRRALHAVLRVDHMPLVPRIAYVGMLAVTLLTLVFLVPGFLIYLTGLHTISQVAGLVPGLVGLVVIMVSLVLGILQVALVLKIPERLEWVRFLLTILLAVSVLEALLRSWAYPSVLAMGMRWDLVIIAAMVVLLWLPSSNRWFVGR